MPTKNARVNQGHVKLGVDMARACSRPRTNDALPASPQIDREGALPCQLGAQVAHYCGESLGGIVGQIFSAERPDRIRTLSTVSSPVYLNPRKLCLAVATFAFAIGAGAAERPYPTKPVRLISAYAPGGGNDTVARAIAQHLTEAFGQQVIVDNRSGANGIVACELTAKAPPDGYTLLMASIASHAINPALLQRAAALPDVPTVAETAPGFEATSWWGIVAPAATPAAIVNTLNREIVKTLGSAEMKGFMENLGAEPRGMTPQQFEAFIRSELTKWS